MIAALSKLAYEELYALRSACEEAMDELGADYEEVLDDDGIQLALDGIDKITQYRLALHLQN